MNRRGVGPFVRQVVGQVGRPLVVPLAVAGALVLGASPALAEAPPLAEPTAVSEPAPAPSPSEAPAPSELVVLEPAPVLEPVVEDAPPSEVTIIPAGTQPEPRIGSGFAGMPDGTTVVLYGGFQGLPESDVDGDARGDTWTFDGTTWSPRCGTTVPGATDPCGPGALVLPAAATAPGGVLLYGGIDPVDDDDQFDTAGTTDDAWLWDGATWVPLCDGCPPGPRAGASAAGNGTVVLLFGGASEDGPRNDLWQWDGVSWVQLDAGGAGAPSPRGLAGFAWDGTQFVLFGGGAFGGDDDDQGPPDPLDDGWVWTGSRWVQVCGAPLAPCGPAGRIFPVFSHLAGPPGLSGAILGAGFVLRDEGPTTYFGDLWLWNGSSFVQLASPWPDSVTTDGRPPFGFPAFGVGASRTADCSVTIFAATPVPSGATEPVPGPLTYSVGIAGVTGTPTCATPAPEQIVGAATLPVTGSGSGPAILLGSGSIAVGALTLVAARAGSRRRRSARARASHTSTG